MIFQAAAITADSNPDDDSLFAIRAALRDLKVSLRKPVEHPRRAEMLDILSEARATIDRINGSA